MNGFWLFLRRLRPFWGNGVIPDRERGYRGEVVGLSPVFVFFPILSLSFALEEDRLGLRRDRTSELSWVGALVQIVWPVSAG